MIASKSVFRKALRLAPISLAVSCLALFAAGAAAQDRVFDVHVHLRQGEQSVAEYLANAEAADVEVTGFAGMWFGGPNQARQGAPALIRSGNDQVLALAPAHPGFVPVVTVHPYDGRNALRELDRVAGLGAKVLKIHPHTQGFDAADPRVLTLVRHAGALNMIVLLDNANILPGDSEKLFNLALAAPDTRFIFAHMGALNFRFWNILSLARTAENVFAENIYFDISGIAVLTADSPLEPEFVWTLRNVGVSRILLGSDYPQIDLATTLQALDNLDLTDEEKTQIRYGNAEHLFGLRAE
jgi:predicted TIM-barrel fold metal-dependent hydrolase